MMSCVIVASNYCDSAIVVRVKSDVVRDSSVDLLTDSVIVVRANFGVLCDSGVDLLTDLGSDSKELWCSA